jgi:hypothetical protein
MGILVLPILIITATLALSKPTAIASCSSVTLSIDWRSEISDATVGLVADFVEIFMVFSWAIKSAKCSFTIHIIAQRHSATVANWANDTPSQNGEKSRKARQPLPIRCQTDGRNIEVIHVRDDRECGASKLDLHDESIWRPHQQLS